MSIFFRISIFISRCIYTFFRLQQNIDDLKILNGKSLAAVNLNNVDSIINNIQNAEFKVFSQWGDDGIIQFLVSYLDIPKKEFVEFGVEDYTESNTRFLLINNNWRGMIMDGSIKNIKSIKKDNIYWRHDLLAISVFITKENINQLIIESGFKGDIGLLNIDIDGNDYWVWKEINIVNPIIVIVEYNSVYGQEKAWTVPYDASFVRSKAHYSDLYFGSSLKALVQLGKAKGYSFIGCNSNGNNAFFVRTDKMKDLKPITMAEGYVVSKFRESRNRNRNLTFVAGVKRLDILKGLAVYNVETDIIEII